jgi:hypothetical protein
MSVGNLAYLALVIAGYAVFIAVLGFVWLRASFAAPVRPDVKVVASANERPPAPAKKVA